MLHGKRCGLTNVATRDAELQSEMKDNGPEGNGHRGRYNIV
jgi:hypothetical protein